MINLRWIKLANFRSFRAPTTVDLRKLSGLVHLSGDNGAGKSSVMEALHWCFFGHTSRGVRAGNVKSWRGRGACAVTVRLEKDTVASDVTRTWGPNALTINGTPATQAEVEQLVGLSEDEFLHSVYRAQFAPSFMDLLPGKQLALYSQVMQLERWEQASERAAKASKTADSEVATLELELAQGRGRLAELKEQLPQLLKDERAWTRSQRELIARKENELRSLRKD